MKNQLLFNFTKILFRKTSFRMAALAVLALLSVQSSFAQSAWVGTTNDFLLGTNWNPNVVTFSTATLNIGPVVSPKFNPELLDGSAATTCTVLNVSSGGILTTSANLTTGTSTNTISGTLNVNKGTYSSRVYVQAGGVINVVTGATLTGVGVWRLGASASSSESFININGGTFNSTGTGTAGLTLGHTAKGTVNIDNGGTYNYSANTGLLVGSAASGTININSGTLNYTSAGALSINATNGLINIDAGSLVLNGDQRVAIQGFIDSGRIKVSGTALGAGKVLSNTYNSGTGKTTVIAVVPSNSAPVANNDAITVAPSGTATILVGGATSVLTNDTDAESNPLTAAVVTSPANGSLTWNSNGTFSYTHNGSATTTDSFTYKANDGTSDSNVATVSITISSVNIAPVANNDAFSVKQGGIATVLTGGATSVLTNDTDAENNTLTATVVTGPANGSLTLNANGTFSYLHNNSATTTDSFTYKANDGTSNSNVATVTITVSAPVATTNTWTGGTSTDFLAASNWTASDAPNPVLFGTLATFTVPNGTANSPVLNANYSTVSGAANCAVLTVNSGAVLTTNANLTTNTATSSVSGTLNISAGTLNLPKFYIGNAVSTAGVVNVSTGATLTGSNVWRIGANATGAGTLNINGGTVTLTGTGTSANITVGHSTTGVVNINSGTLNVNYTYTTNTFATSFIITSNGIINIDAGSIVLPGNQISDISAFIDNSTNTGKIRVSGAALTAGKILSTTYDSGTDKTIVIAVSPPNTTWNGTWSNGTPTATVEAIIAGVYSTGTNGSFTAKKLTVNSGSLTINSNTNLTVQNEVINNAGVNGIVVENNANLIQVLGTTNTNTGNIVVNRNGNALYRLDYTMWSSPVAGQNLVAFSPLTSQNPSRFYTYDPNAGTVGLYSAIVLPTLTTTNFAAGTGYLIRMPNTDPISGYDAGSTTLAYPGVFTGVPNNGNVSLTGLTSDKYYAVGNPYPSTLSANAFINGNSTGGTLYFWRKKNAGAGSAYASYNLVGATVTATASGNGSAVPNGTIQVGQGFIVKTGVAATTLTFTNAMREAAPTSTQFFKTKNVAEKDRVWLNLTNVSGAFSQALVGYMDGATSGVDAGIDGVYINDSAVALTSVINGEEYTIQGRALPFDPSDVVPLNFKTDAAGDYTIAIDHADGLFATGQDVYLVDSTTGAETNLKTDAYTFTATTGAANSRFSLKYQKTLKVDVPAFNENSVRVYKNNGTLYVNSGANTISNIEVFDIQGRLIAEQKNVNANATSIKNWKTNSQVLIVKVTAQDNAVVTKKVVN